MLPTSRLSFASCLQWLVVNLLLVSWPSTAASNAEGNALSEVKKLLSDPNNELSSWNSDLVNPCSSWQGVSCLNDRVTSVDIAGLGLSGTLSSAISLLPELQSLGLQNNMISGSLPSELGNLSQLVALKAQNNSFNGTIPSSLGNLTRLETLLLNNNHLQGEIPTSISKISSLTSLDLSDNNLTGQIPAAAFNIQSHNFSGNHLDCGSNSTHSCQSSNSPPPSNQTSNTASIVGGLVVGAAIISCVAVAIICCARQRRHRSRFGQEVFVDVPAEDELKIAFGQLKRFSWRELQNATNDFNELNVIGQGAFAKVYKGVLKDNTEVGVKRMLSTNLEGGETAFLQEVEMISVAVHRNLLHLIGFCITPSERILVYPYMPNKSVAYCLRDRKKGEPGLDWSTRKKIALGAARGLEYLHDHCNPKIIHRDVKAANVLLNGEYEAVVGDFGLAKLVDTRNTHVTTMVRGTMGHIAPEYLSTGKSSEKTDVFGYGVMLLELVTSQRAIDFARLQEEDDVLLLDHVKKLQHEKRLDMIVDTNLSDYDVQEVEQMIQVALLCTQPSPEHRPTMAEVVRMLSGEGLAERWEEWQQVEVIRRQESEAMPHRLVGWFEEDSTVNQEAIQLSAAR